MRFSGAEGKWSERLGSLRNVVRQALVTRQLIEHLPATSCRILDVGCGQGTQALRMAARGHRVTALDASRELLGLLEAGVQPGMRVHVVQAEAERLGELFEPGGFDVVLCHGVLMYFDDPGPLLADLARMLAPGGLLSLLVRNGDALALRPGLRGDWAAARRAFDGTHYVNRLGVPARADRLDDLTARLAVPGLEVRRWYGVRVLTDAVPDDAPIPADLDDLLAAEERAGRTDPYRRVAALTHLICQARSGGSGGIGGSGRPSA
ncbi:2-polyprenyl-3-methyl-5-hydroxy-6-metoxy-1,4-benzoquinol methylase [Nonomuraea solani]|uniref:2-polyprenyl-3-methyl-5-hydroxy-6-metoxy-1,4-benzoquinol methylase n=1 Tax=Nonomuraea solani TaxID=1144553 RepID=A0A1H5YPB6_9ACTN|nr:methyltransferase domain-containing protein [Nonomuraea solani]SEG25959.1 2-polyprenyl-3-methyl-5-hydroxy-6-metoxy-1,4-benzoquinol methylase [Nonomuraea solani]